MSSAHYTYLTLLLLTLIGVTFSGHIQHASNTRTRTNEDPVCGLCGYPPVNFQCCPECPYFDSVNQLCVPSCGMSCTSDGDCGDDVNSVCSACVKKNGQNEGTCKSNADFKNCEQQDPWQPGQPQAPILPSAWNSSVLVSDYKTDETIKGFTWYDSRFGGLRIDFFGKCPFVQLAGNRNNDVECTVLFYKGFNYYIYPSEKICCGYKFSVWNPDNYR